jgi:dTMP kinase
MGIPNILTKQPGGWGEDSQVLRELLLSPLAAGLHPFSRALLFAADRAEHIRRVVLPALQDGITVVVDRWELSLIAYCAAAGGMLRDAMVLADWSSVGVRADATVVIAVPPTLAYARLLNRDGESGLTVYERRGEGFARTVASVMGLFGPEDRVHHVDGVRRKDEVEAEIWGILGGLWGS